jgi:hypothetical protein
VPLKDSAILNKVKSFKGYLDIPLRNNNKMKTKNKKITLVLTRSQVDFLLKEMKTNKERKYAAVLETEQFMDDQVTWHNKFMEKRK